jgi:hypothetical protein
MTVNSLRDVVTSFSRCLSKISWIIVPLRMYADVSKTYKTWDGLIGLNDKTVHYPCRWNKIVPFLSLTIFLNVARSLA